MSANGSLRLESVHTEEDAEQAIFELLEEGHGNRVCGLKQLLVFTVPVDDELSFIEVALHIMQTNS
jgi:hypothetical protein